MNRHSEIQNIYLAILLLATILPGCGSKSKIRPKDYFTDPQVIELAEAAMKGDLKTIDRLVAKGVDVSALDKHNCSKKVHFSTLGLNKRTIGLTPLHFAMLGKNKKSFLRLLEHKADPNIQDKNGNSIISLVAEIEKDPEWLKMVLKHGGKPNLIDSINSTEMLNRTTPIFNAIGSKNIENVKLLVKAGANLDQQDGSGFTPSMQTLSYGWYECLYHLLKSGANWKLKTENGHDLAFQCFSNPVSKKYKKDYEYQQKVFDFLKAKGVDLDAAKKAADKHAGR